MADRRNRTRYPGVVDGNLARKLDNQELERRLERSGQLDFDQQYRRRKESEAEQLARPPAQVKASVRPAQKVNKGAVLGFMAVAAMMMVLLLCYVKINAISRSIVQMKEEIKELQVERVSLLTQYEQKFDLASVKAAAEAAGMSPPSESQIYYIDLPGADQAVAHGSESGGVLDRFFASLGRDVYAAMEYFR